ncbi:MAG: B12-binding domain-containing radical SAM protein [Phycisphaerae bacterium]|nr:B12-binding domain-containing radical SAM protein [Phycisphaerae bacterium]
MRIALVNPVARRTEGYHTIGTAIPHLGLQVLARRVPPGHQVEIIEEIFGQARTAELLTAGRYDLVGVTAYSSGATRAYELAALCRARKLPCILGGSHASAVPQEAARYFDSVAVGECDEVWPQIIADAAAGRLQPMYRGQWSELRDGLGAADQSVQPINGRYDVGCIQTTRGCPVGCDFCSVTRFNGPRFRHRPIDEVVQEWNTTTRKFLFVVDDNFFGVGRADADWAKALLRALITRGKRRLWFSQTTVNMGGDREALRLAYRAGCRGMLVGFETFNPVNLKQYHKGLNAKLLDDYRVLVDGFHAAGVAVFGAFIVGGDDDTEDTVSDTVLAAVRLGVDIMQLTNLTPLPGTKMYDRYMAEGRIFATNYPVDWERYTFVETVYDPRRVSARRLDETICELRQAAATHRWVWKRTLRSLLATRSLSTALFVHGMNKGWVRLARAQAPRDVERFGLPAPGVRSEKILRSFALNPGPAVATS